MWPGKNWTTAELARSVGRIERSIDELNKKVDEKLVSFQYYTSRHDDLISRIDKIEAEREADKSWKRIVSLAVVTSAVGLIGSIAAQIIH